MAEEFDPEAYMDSKLETGESAPAPLPPPSGAPPSDDGDRGEREERDERKSSRRDRSRSRSRSRDRRRSRSRDRGSRRGDDRYRAYDSRGRGGDRDRDRDRGGARRYDDNYKLETDRRSSRDDKKAEDPSNDEEGFDRDMRTLFVAQVARKAHERDLFQFFSDSGKVVDVRIIKDAQSRKSKGIAYVEFEKQEQVLAALQKSGQLVCGFPIVVQASQAEKNQAARLAAQVAGDVEVPTKVRVENLHPEITEQDLTELFTPFGKVVTVRIERVNNRSSGLGHVEFKTLPDAQKAVAHLNGFDLAGKPLRVIMTSNPPPPPAAVGAGMLGGGGLSAPGALMGMMQQPGGIPGMPPTMQNPVLVGLQQKLAMTQNQPGVQTDTLDDDASGGVHMAAQSRHMLMQKLARNTDLQGMGLQFAPTMPAPPPPGVGVGITVMPGVPMGQANPSTYVILVNMFNPETEEDKDFHLDIQEDVKEECEAKFGKVLQCVADKTNKNGLVYLQFDSIESAAKAQAGLQGRFFAGKQIIANYLSKDTFDTSLPRNQ